MGHSKREGPGGLPKATNARGAEVDLDEREGGDVVVQPRECDGVQVEQGRRLDRREREGS